MYFYKFIGMCENWSRYWNIDYDVLINGLMWSDIIDGCYYEFVNVE